MPRSLHRLLRLCNRCMSSAASGSGSRSQPVKRVIGSNYATAVLNEARGSWRDEVCSTSLSESIAGLPDAKYATDASSAELLANPYHTDITVLDNGLTVASSPHFGEFCTVGVCIDAGSRYEGVYPSGVSHFLQKMAFGRTKSFTDRDVYAELEKHSGICDCQATKDTFIYAASCHVTGLDPVIKVIAEAATKPLISAEDIQFGRTVVEFDLEDMNREPNPDHLLTNFIHKAAYHENTLGLSSYATPETIPYIDRAILFSFLRSYFTPDRMVVAGVGVNHKDLVTAVTKHFVNDPPIWTTDDEVKQLPKSEVIDRSAPKYTGGQVRVTADLSSVSLGPTPMPELAHFMIGLESCAFLDPDFVPFCVLNSLMGGGGSFSAGGPGKGMYTRLYTNVLNRYHWMYNATSFNHVYSDSGLYCIHASANPKQLWDVVNVIVQEIIDLTGDIRKEELDRAKTQLKSTLLMNIEQRPVMFEDVARQVLGHGYRKSPFEYIEEIDKVTEADIHRIVERMLASRPSVVGYGSLRNLPDLTKIDESLIRRETSPLKPSRFFPF